VNSKGQTEIDQSIQNGFDWLVKTINKNYDILHKRVGQDVQKRKENEEREREEPRKKVSQKPEE
jgi:hypothetical protein